eukprot:Platyproteum_vivax@DN8569_c0_g1_i1.p1
MTVAHYVGQVASLFSFLVYLAPIVDMWRIVKSKTVHSFVPFYILTFQCLFWTLYAVIVKEYQVVTTSLVGVCLGICYCIIPGLYACPRDRKRVIIMSYICVGAAIVYSLLLFLAVKKTEDQISIAYGFAFTCNIVLWFSPLNNLLNVWKTQHLEGTPIALVLACFLSSLLWMSYAVIKLSLLLFLSNCTGTCVNGAQLAILMYIIKVTKGDALDPAARRLYLALGNLYETVFRRSTESSTRSEEPLMIELLEVRPSVAPPAPE